MLSTYNRYLVNEQKEILISYTTALIRLKPMWSSVKGPVAKWDHSWVCPFKRCLHHLPCRRYLHLHSDMHNFLEQQTFTTPWMSATATSQRRAVLHVGRVSSEDAPQPHPTTQQVKATWITGYETAVFHFVSPAMKVSCGSTAVHAESPCSRENQMVKSPPQRLQVRTKTLS